MHMHIYCMPLVVICNRDTVKHFTSDVFDLDVIIALNNDHGRFMQLKQYEESDMLNWEVIFEICFCCNLDLKPWNDLSQKKLRKAAKSERGQYGVIFS